LSVLLVQSATTTTTESSSAPHLSHHHHQNSQRSHINPKRGGQALANTPLSAKSHTFQRPHIRSMSSIPSNPPGSEPPPDGLHRHTRFLGLALTVSMDEEELAN
ncbi:MAG: hypothetical protein ABJF50_20580, partial [Paracoccaceae bacterium]